MTSPSKSALFVEWNGRWWTCVELESYLEDDTVTRHCIRQRWLRGSRGDDLVKPGRPQAKPKRVVKNLDPVFVALNAFARGRVAA